MPRRHGATTALEHLRLQLAVSREGSRPLSLAASPNLARLPLQLVWTVLIRCIPQPSEAYTRTPSR